MRPLELSSMSEPWLLDHVATLERTVARLKAEGTTRGHDLAERYSMMLAAAKLELARRSDDE